ncbi:MAG: thiamine diphosphokinase [Pseudomonadota bacterium]
MLTLIFANGDLADTSELPDLQGRADLIIAVDGGANHCRELRIIPDALIGDFDSVSPAVLKEFQEQSVAIHRHPAKKDATDLELALDFAIAKGAREVWLLGGLGGRWDMSFANILLIAGDTYKALNFTVPGPDCIMHVLHPGKPFTLHGMPGQKVSLLPLRGDVQDLSLHGFEYPLKNATLRFGSTHGVSNVLQKPGATVQFNSGVLLCIRMTTPAYNKIRD